MLCVKQRSIKSHFLSLWYDSTWDWTLVSSTIGEQSTHSANGPVIRPSWAYLTLKPSCGNQDQEKENSEFKPFKLSLKIDFCRILLVQKGLIYMYMYIYIYMYIHMYVCVCVCVCVCTTTTH